MIDSIKIFEKLQSTFGFSRFRENQQEIVSSILDKKDVFAIMPTGGGKSLCYQLPAVLLDGCCVVISPLISLMKDQVDAAAANGIRAAAINSTQGESVNYSIFRKLEQNNLDLLYVSPERFSMESFINTLGKVKISFFAIDEAHCISQWGHDFRPDYLSLSNITTLFPHIPITAFTATATNEVQVDIRDRLHLRNPFVVRASFNRPNLHYSVEPRTNTDQQILSYVGSRVDKAGIIYRTTRQSVEKTVAMLRNNGVKAVPYHAGLNDSIRAKNQEDFRQDKVPIVVATIAFGMGIDKPNIRYVLHADLSKSIENYYQETGRAGRDGDPAECMLFFSRGDVPKIKYFFNEITDPQERARQESSLNKVINYAASFICRRKSLLSYFGEQLGKCEGCDVCNGEHETVDITIDAQKVISAVARTGERFGAGYVTEFIYGANTKDIRAQKHDTLKTWGVGKDKPKTYWRQVIDELVSEGLLARSDGDYPTLKIAPDGWEVVRGKKIVEVLRNKARPIIDNKKFEEFENDPLRMQLFSSFRSERAKIAESMNVPPYVVFHDRTLKEMASRLPATPEQMRSINGIGEMKLEKFGSRFMDIISQFRLDHPEVIPLSQAAYQAKPAADFKPKNTALITETVEQTKVLLIDQMMSLEQAAAARNLATSTIAEHLERLLLAGVGIDINTFVSPEKQQLLIQLFEKNGTDRLSPVVNDSNGQVTFEDAKIVRGWLKGSSVKQEGCL